MESDHRKPRKPVQARSQKTREKILRAAERLFGEKGLHSVNSKEIAAEAGVAVGTFYNYFPDKQDLFLEVFERHSMEVSRVLDGRIRDEVGRGGGGREFIFGLVKAVYEAHSLSPDFHRQAEALKYSDPSMAARRKQEHKEAHAKSVALMAGFGDKLRITDHEAAAEIVSLAVESVVHELKMFGSDVSEFRMLKELADMLTRYLFRDDT